MTTAVLWEFADDGLEEAIFIGHDENDLDLIMLGNHFQERLDLIEVAPED